MKQINFAYYIFVLAVLLISCTNPNRDDRQEIVCKHHIRYYTPFYSFDLINDTLYVKELCMGDDLEQPEMPTDSLYRCVNVVPVNKADLEKIDSLVSEIRYTYICGTYETGDFEDALVIDGETVYYSMIKFGFMPQQNKRWNPTALEMISSTSELIKMLIDLGDSDLYRRWRNYPYYPDDK